MKKLKNIISWNRIAQILGVVIGVIAIYFSFKNINGADLKQALVQMKTFWIVPIIVGNFCVIVFKAMRWQIMIRPVKKIAFPLMYKVLTIGFMANNVLPIRLGEAVRVHILGKDADVSRLTTTATLITDRVVETISFLIMAAVLIMITDVPKWLHSGLIITLALTIGVCIATAVYSKRNFKNRFLKTFQDGLKPLLHVRTTSLALFISIFSWGLQGVLIYMTQLAYGVHLPVWGILLILISINLAVALPSAPGYVGTFEFACILAYSYLGIDKNLGLLMGITYHLLQMIPVTLVGGLWILADQRGRTLLSAGRKEPC